jgi:hypothetical protein
MNIGMRGAGDRFHASRDGRFAACGARREGSGFREGPARF